jgi:imidazolonepropionase
MGVLRRIGTLATCPALGGSADLGSIKNAALVWESGTVVWLGPDQDLPERFRGEASTDCSGKLVVPGLIDAHTHLLFAGWRAEEYEAKLRGASYLDILKAGGGILSTVRMTRAESDQALTERARKVLDQQAALGITTIEAKTGYGLSFDQELRALRLYQQLRALSPVEIVSTCLAAHALPSEFSNDRVNYLRMIEEQLIPAVAREALATSIDVFVENGAFGAEEARGLARRAGEFGLGVRLHVDQLAPGQGAELGVELGALSVDHLECISERGIASLAASSTVGVLLPLASLYLGKKPAPARAMIEAGCRIAIATDFNPGSAPSYHLPLAMMLGCSLLRLTPSEVLRAATINAAIALRISDRVGSIEVGKAADLALIDAPDPTTWLYHFRDNACLRTIKSGKTIYEANR